MRNNVIVKVFTLFVLAGIFMIPLMLIWNVVSERSNYRDRVAAEVAQTTAGPQLLFGPVLVIETPGRVVRAAAGGRDSIVPAVQQVVLPDSLRVNSVVQVEPRRRGIYRVPVYRAAHHLVATFPKALQGANDRAWLAFGVGDTRGMRTSPTLRLGGAPIAVQPGSGLAWIPKGFSAALGRAPDGNALALEADIELIGTERAGVVPLGANTDVTMESNWPHPGFTGGFGPDERAITSHGFQARWRLSSFATGVPGAVASREQANQYDKIGCDITVKFVQPVDVYQQSERAVKYGMLFVTLTFVAFFLFEILRRLAIHPIQYGLVAAALALFFLLLVSLSEHVSFAAAYLVSSAACIGLVVFYAGHVLGSLARGLGFGAFLAALYALLYVILLSEDYALLLGTLLLFGALAVVMVMTRRVDWYRMGEGAVAGTPGASRP